MRKLLALVVAVFALAGCAGDPNENGSSPPVENIQDNSQTGDGESHAVDIESVVWATCDSEESQPLTQLFDKAMRVYNPSCPTDRTRASLPLPRVEAATTSLEPCMLQENSLTRTRYGDEIIGAFPRTSAYGVWPSMVELTMIVVPMEWPDLRGETSPMEIIEPAVQFTDEFFRVFSRGQVTFNWRIYDEWIMSPDESEAYFVSDEEMSDQHGAMRRKAEVYFPKVIEFTDPIVDYSDADLVLYVWPQQQDLFTQYNMWDDGENGIGPYQSDEGPIKQAFTGGKYHFREVGGLGQFWAHEMGHAFGLPDLNWRANDWNNYQDGEESLPGPFNGYDLMAGYDATRTMSSWLMFLANWIGESEIHCLDTNTFESGSFDVYPITDETPTLKSLMIPLDERFQIVVESRRLSQFDVAEAFKTRSREGVLIYVVDASKGQGDGTQILIAPSGRGLYKYSIENKYRTQELDAIFYEGNTVDIAGYRITVNEFRPDRDLVSISRIEESEIEYGDYVCITEENYDRSRVYEEYCPLEAILPTG